MRSVRPTWRSVRVGAVTLAVIGYGFSIADGSISGSGDLGRASLGLLLLAVVSVLAEIRDALRAPKKMREIDYEQGYRDGARAERRRKYPNNLVLLPSPDDKAAGS